METKYSVSTDQNTITHENGRTTEAVFDELASCSSCCYAVINPCPAQYCRASTRKDGIGVVFSETYPR